MKDMTVSQNYNYLDDHGFTLFTYFFGVFIKNMRPILITLTVFFALTLAYTANAQESVSTAKGLALAPIRTEVDIKPGTSFSRALQLTNYSNQLMNVHLNVDEFGVINQQYDYRFNDKTATSKWVSFVADEVRLKPGASKVVPYVINVPSTAEPGGRYISLLATTDVPTAPGEIRTQQRVASLVYLTVQGDVTRVGSLKSLNSPFIFDGYQSWKMAIANTGTTHFRSKYTVSIKNIFDGHEVATASDSALILPHTTRAIAARVPAPKYIGVYRIDYTIGLGDTPAAKREYYIIFLPKQAYASLVSLSVIVVAGASYAALKFVRRKKSTD